MLGPFRERARDSRRWLAQLWSGALDLALPPTCAGCAAPIQARDALCEHCDRRLPRLADDSCALCQAVRVTSAAGLSAGPSGGLCASCEFALSPLAACVAAVAFSGDVESWIHRFKYPRAGLAGLDPAPRSVVEALVCEAAGRVTGPAPGLVVPVPLHPSRLRSRGFNPAALLARSVARRYGLRYDPVALRRTRPTQSQTSLDRAARRRNVRAAFRTRRRWRAPECVWLLDDVVTTGSTLSECARALRRAGVKTVVGICAARTMGSGQQTGSRSASSTEILSRRLQTPPAATDAR
ncbi:MAG: double zinc ribbon domain-containing protein [Myxococcota bacterium]